MPSIKNKLRSLFNKTRRKRQSADKPVGKIRPSLIPFGNKKIFMTILFLCVALLGYYLIPLFVSYFRSEFVKAPGDSRSTSELSYKSRVNILLVGFDEYNSGGYRFIDSISLLSYDYRSKEVGVFGINPDIRISIPGLNRQIEIRSFWNLSQIKGSETDYLIDSIENLLATKIDRYIFVSKEGFFEISKLFPSMQIKLDRDLRDNDTLRLPTKEATNLSKGINNVDGSKIINVIASDANGKDDQLDREVSAIVALVKNAKSLKVIFSLNDIWLAMVKNLETNLSKNELLKLVYDMSGTRDDMVKRGFTRSASYEALPSTGVYGGSNVIMERLDKDLSSIFFDVNVFKEQAQIEIYNASGVRGFASSRNRWITNMGGNVVRVANAEENIDPVVIYCLEPEKYQITIDAINKIFADKAILKKEKYYSRQIGNIVIVIGRKYQ
jgi:anionic cell wall polymer biosynthesis LytR-Cps2A-Psr (LCP) family protein